MKKLTIGECVRTIVSIWNGHSECPCRLKLRRSTEDGLFSVNFNKHYAEVWLLGLLSFFTETNGSSCLLSGVYQPLPNCRINRELFIKPNVVQSEYNYWNLPALMVFKQDVVFTHEVKENIIFDSLEIH